MPRVFAPQVPSRFDSALRLWVPTVNMKPAEKFGELRVMFQPDAYRLAPVPMVTAMKEIMVDFAPDDYLVAVGSPTLIAAASVLAANKNGGRLRLLTWDRQSDCYYCTEMKL